MSDEFNEFLLSCFETPAGQKVLAGLMNRYGTVLPPTATDAELRHREGQRSVLAEIMKGMADGRERRRNAGSSGSDAGKRSSGRGGPSTRRST
jgi:hypothetical protein